ncbi:hypothetical protein B0H16DRAFT_1528366 [Mycena metata]|uniref:3-beta hydroxysteroid dehydrogenase/isomerase domain-containing protein n=1 Tax=Mycena metata TaxID=1033252 RepID=A0AAD7NJL0_9AGAR|nr:hypothetical protein B0H16DRAFT_1528366 [Mycena metata]
MSQLTQESYLVVGGGTTTGAAIVRLLLQQSGARVSIFEAYPLHPRVAAQFGDHVHVYVEDLFAPKAVADAIRSCQATCIIHTGTLTVPEQARVCHPDSPPSQADYKLAIKKVNEEHRRVSMEGTQNLISVAHDTGVKKLVYVGYADAFFNGKELQHLREEDAKYPAKPWLAVMGPRLEGERLVLAANGVNSLTTAVIRPASVFGGTHLDYILLRTAQTTPGFTSVSFDNDKAIVDRTFVDNVAHAVLLAAARLDPIHPNHQATAGHTFFVSDDDARPFWSFHGALWGAVNQCAAPKMTSFSASKALRSEWKKDLSDKLHRRPDEENYRKMCMVFTTRTYDISRAREVLGYAPIVSHNEGIRRTAEAWLEVQLQLCKNAGQDNQPPPPYTRSDSTKIPYVGF